MTDEVYFHDMAARDQMRKFVQQELRRDQTGDAYRARWHGRPVGSGAPSFSTPCDCCDELETVQGYVIESTRNCCQYTPDEKLYLTESHGIYQSEAFACVDDYATEWTLDTASDPITATIRTTDGDVVYSIAASSWQEQCLNIMTLASKPSDCNAGGCVKVYPLACERLRTLCPNNGCELEHVVSVDLSPLASRVDVALGGPAKQWFNSSLDHVPNPFAGNYDLTMPASQISIALNQSDYNPCLRTGSTDLDQAGQWRSSLIATHGYSTATRKNYLRLQFYQHFSNTGAFPWQLHFVLSWQLNDGACVNAPATLPYGGYYSPRGAMVITDVPETLEVS